MTPLHENIQENKNSKLFPSKSLGNILNKAKINRETEKPKNERISNKFINYLIPNEIQKEAKNLLPKFEEKTEKMDEIIEKRKEISEFIRKSEEVKKQILDEIKAVKEKEKLFIFDEKILNNINLDIP
ncbi:hypothetical protein ACQ4LE_004899 [Meloidogyne hapla]|uniref:Uncharacterized protein n=1 Tax=Meloidogyne hapla TaxID=6305 RepID=A0A1I8AZW1_MELHA